MSPRVVGLDLSLTGTGMSDGTTHLRIPTDTSLCVEERLDLITKSVGSFLRWPRQADLAVIEASAYSKNSQPGHEELAGVRLFIRHRCWAMGIPFAMVAPSGMKAFTTGNGKATKPQVYKALRTRHGLNLDYLRVEADGRYDVSDAYGLAAMGYAHLDRAWSIPQPTLPFQGPPAPLKSLLAVKWPDVPAPA